MGRARLVKSAPVEELPENDAVDEGQTALFEEPDDPPPQIVTSVSVARSSPPSNELPLFPGLAQSAVRAASKLLLWRVTPSSHAGYLGEALGVRATEEDIRRTYGGRVFRLELRDSGGRTMSGGARTLEIEADPKRPDGDTRGASPGVDVEAVVRRAIDPFREELERAKALAKLEREEQEAKAKRALEEERQRRKDDEEERAAKHKRELETLDARARADVERERVRHEQEMKREEQRAAAALAQQQQMVTLVVKSQEENTKVLVATLQASKAEKTGIGQLSEMAALLNELRGPGEDPQVAMVRGLSESLGAFAKMNDADTARAMIRVGGPRGGLPSGPAPVATSRPVRANPSPVASSAPTATPTPPASIEENLTAIASDWQAQGLDPAQIVQALRDGKLALVDPNAGASPAPSPASSTPTAPTAPTGAPSPVAPLDDDEDYGAAPLPPPAAASSGAAS